MRWGKFILMFQAFVTLIIGVFMLMQVFYIEERTISAANDITANELQELDMSYAQYKQSVELEAMQAKLVKSSYILVLIALIEVIIISRLVR